MEKSKSNIEISPLVKKTYFVFLLYYIHTYDVNTEQLEIIFKY